MLAFPALFDSLKSRKHVVTYFTQWTRNCLVCDVRPVDRFSESIVISLYIIGFRHQLAIIRIFASPRFFIARGIPIYVFIVERRIILILVE